MKIKKSQLKEIIKEEIEEQLGEPTTQNAQPEKDSRQKKVAAATTSGSMLSAEQYVDMLKKVLLTKKISPQSRKQALEAIFGQKGAAINTLVLQMLKGAKQ